MLNSKQGLLFSVENIFDIHPLKNYETLFGFLELLIPQEPRHHGAGRPKIPKISLLKALIYKNLRGLLTLSDLVQDLSCNPSLLIKCGFLIDEPPPTKETFSSFLRNTEHSFFTDIKKSIVLELVKLKELNAKLLSIDSAPIKANVKENNLKTSHPNRFDKHHIPKGDPDARMGVTILFKPNDLFSKQVQYFWGYRTHVVSDAITELPIIERTLPANIHDSKVCISLLKEIIELGLSPEGITADAAFDSQEILSFIINDLKAKPYIARNPRNKPTNFQLSPKGYRICIAGLPMRNWGTFKDGNKRTRKKFVCPIKLSKKFSKLYPSCPVSHPKFHNPQGCTAYLRIDQDIRKTIDYGSPKFDKIYNMRTCSERVFSRIINLALRNIPVKGIAAISNYLTLAHISALLVALTAVKTGNRNKIRYFKSFIKDL
jgi:hypothetical protein